MLGHQGASPTAGGRELRCSLAELGVHESHMLDYPDGECHRFDGTEIIAGYIEAIQPTLIVTFGPDGLTGHGDHRAVSQWTTSAWLQTGSRSELWYPTLTPEYHARWSSVNNEIGLWMDQSEPPCTRADQLAGHVDLDEPLLDLKFAALRARRIADGLVDRVARRTRLPQLDPHGIVPSPQEQAQHAAASVKISRSNGPIIRPSTPPTITPPSVGYVATTSLPGIVVTEGRSMVIARPGAIQVTVVPGFWPAKVIRSPTTSSAVLEEPTTSTRARL